MFNVWRISIRDSSIAVGWPWVSMNSKFVSSAGHGQVRDYSPDCSVIGTHIHMWQSFSLHNILKDSGILEQV